MQSIVKAAILAALLGSCAGDVYQYVARSSLASVGQASALQEVHWRFVCGPQGHHAIDFERYEPVAIKGSKTLQQYEDFRNLKIVFEPRKDQSRNIPVWTSLYFDNGTRPENFPTGCDLRNPASYGVFGKVSGRINIARKHQGKEILDFAVLNYECENPNDLKSKRSECMGELTFQHYRLPIPVACHSEQITNPTLAHHSGDDDDDDECERI